MGFLIRPTRDGGWVYQLVSCTYNCVFFWIMKAKNILVLLGGYPQKVLHLLDSGNAVLKEIVSGITKWESFSNPTNTFLPGMKMDVNLKLTSWKDATDPSSGSFSFEEDETNQYAIRNIAKATYHWKSGSGSVKTFNREPLFPAAYYLLSNSTKPLYKTNYCESNPKTLNYCNYSANSFVFKNYSRLLMNHTGHIQYFSWEEMNEQWVLDWQVPKDDCSIYGLCGKFSVCSLSNTTSSCKCLTGFERIPQQDASAGCKRNVELSCNDSDEFQNMSMINIQNPTLPFVNYDNETACKKLCLQRCECVAYSYTPEAIDQFKSGRLESVSNSCWIWDSDLYNLQTDGRHNISIRVSHGTLLKFSAFILSFLIVVMLIPVIFTKCTPTLLNVRPPYEFGHIVSLFYS
ncbi:putative non-specific serine/threonine protein kinase [Helianthus annuus]|uniref:Non-specific serine/threonine protein kinase n=1 Tax=Helianthus annuus TaxID=4232 RepID=A0A251RSS9_HELAN|nr:putative non-specific serine/threonine protein kinase [Helianthus annuus]KAJ0813637.1 putative non-specific serine/threonine protein kinase [Helianthus annuus]KAJ0826772.1 putative non-specific serine/threonine protein kinase [Helianthus annuus]